MEACLEGTLSLTASAHTRSQLALAGVRRPTAPPAHDSGPPTVAARLTGDVTRPPTRLY